MAEPSVELVLRTNGADVTARQRAIRNVVAIAVRPSFTLADAAMLDLVPIVPRPRYEARAVTREATSATEHDPLALPREAVAEVRCDDRASSTVNGSDARWARGGRRGAVRRSRDLAGEA